MQQGPTTGPALVGLSLFLGNMLHPYAVWTILAYRRAMLNLAPAASAADASIALHQHLLLHIVHLESKQ